jgi:hypothetical protein
VAVDPIAVEDAPAAALASNAAQAAVRVIMVDTLGPRAVLSSSLKC